MIFNRLYINSTIFFLFTLLMMGLIVWTIQAVNYFDYVTEDGHGLKVYFLYSLMNFPKIINRLLPFIFFISLFYILLGYEKRNELNIFWINGVTKIKFINKIISISLLITIIQIILSSYLSPFSQLKARNYLKNSDLNFFTYLIKPGKFLNVAKDMTIFIEMKNKDNSFKNVFIEDNRNSSRLIYAKKGVLISERNNKRFKLYNGEIINNNNLDINVFKFDAIDLDLSDIKTKTITAPKIQELGSILLLKCILKKKTEITNFICSEEIYPVIKEELFKRNIKPFYIPLLALIASCLVIFSKQKKNYNKIKNFLFLFAFLVIIFSEVTLRYIGSSSSYTYVYLLFPFFMFIIVYSIANKVSSNA